MRKENRPPGGVNAGADASEFQQTNCTAPRRRVKRSDFRLSEDGRKALDLLYAKLDQRIEEGDEGRAAVNARHIARIHRNHGRSDGQE